MEEEYETSLAENFISYSSKLMTTMILREDKITCLSLQASSPF